jgi:hypothetical protein
MSKTYIVVLEKKNCILLQQFYLVLIMGTIGKNTQIAKTAQQRAQGPSSFG